MLQPDWLSTQGERALSSHLLHILSWDQVVAHPVRNTLDAIYPEDVEHASMSLWMAAPDAEDVQLICIRSETLGSDQDRTFLSRKLRRTFQVLLVGLR